MADKRKDAEVASPGIGAQVTGLGLGLILLGGLASAAFGQDTAATDETVIVSHGYSNFGTLKYGPDMAHLAYVNPEAPKGGEMSVWSPSVFDSFNPFTRKGVAEFTGASLIYEDILTGTADDPY